jgi:hypothetical protein
MLKYSSVNNNLKNITRARTAGITVEVTLSLALAIVSLFLVLSLFASNLSTMATNSGIKNLFSRDNELAKTAQTKWTKHPTDTTVTVSDNSQENVQIVADQGLTLDEYIANAQATIDKYKETPPTTLSEIEDLAKAVTIAKINSNTTLDYAYYYQTYGINARTNSYVTTVTNNGQTYSLSFESVAANTSDSTSKLDITKYITNTNFTTSG